ncbi:MAG: hypothetical protein QM696_12125 [Steroidobacteraceae bacterium]
MTAMPQACAQNFIARFSQKSLPTDLPLQFLSGADAGGLKLAAALKEAGLVASNFSRRTARFPRAR